MQFLHEGSQSLVFETLLHPQSCLVVDGRDVVDALAYRVYIHHAPAREKEALVTRAILIATKKSLCEGEKVFLVERRAIIIVDVVVADEIMSNLFLLPWGRGCGAYRYFRVYLP